MISFNWLIVFPTFLEVGEKIQNGFGKKVKELKGIGKKSKKASYPGMQLNGMRNGCLLYTSDAADDLLCVDLGGRRIIKKKINTRHDDTM